MRTLKATSPHIRGEPVKRFQQRLKRNHFGQDFLQGPVDGDCGPETCRAFKRAKFWLGYPLAECLTLGGERLYRLLGRGHELPLAMARVRARRMATKQRDPLRLKALERAERDLGMKESPARSNLSPISRRWGVQGPWCAMAVSEWYLDAGSKAFALHKDFAYVPYLLAAAEQGAHGLAIVRQHVALPGDVVCFDWDDDGVADHTGLLRSPVHLGAQFETIEGNTAVGNDSNGGQVMHRDRALGEVATFHRAPAFIRVGR